MAVYDSSRTGQAHDNDENRLTTLENNTSCLSSSGTTAQFLRGDKTWSNNLAGQVHITSNFGDSNAAIIATDTSHGAWRYAFQGACPDLESGERCVLSLGKTISTGNSAQLYFRWFGQANVDNYMGVEFHGYGTRFYTTHDGRTYTTKLGINETDLSTYHLNMNGKLKITASVTDGVNAGGIYLNLSRTSGTYLRGISMMCNNMAAGTRLLYCTGYSDAKYNMGQIYFYYDGDGSTANRLSLGMHSTDDIINIIAGTGNVGIKTVSPSYTLHVAGSIYGSSIVNGSKRALKKNIKDYTNNATELIKTIKICSFNLIEQPEDNKIGFIADDTHEIFAGKDHDIMDINNCIGMLLKAVQELSAENEELKQRISKLEQVINNGG